MLTFGQILYVTELVKTHTESIDTPDLKQNKAGGTFVYRGPSIIQISTCPVNSSLLVYRTV